MGKYFQTLGLIAGAWVFVLFTMMLNWDLPFWGALIGGLVLGVVVCVFVNALRKTDEEPWSIEAYQREAAGELEPVEVATAATKK